MEEQLLAHWHTQAYEKDSKAFGIGKFARAN